MFRYFILIFSLFISIHWSNSFGQIYDREPIVPSEYSQFLSEIKYGHELSFSSFDELYLLVGDQLCSKAREKFLKFIPGFKLSKESDYDLEYPGEQVWFRTKEFPDADPIEFSNDAYVVEIRAKPKTIAGYQLEKGAYNALYYQARRNGFFPTPIVGSGHISVDLVALLDKPKILSNYLYWLISYQKLFTEFFENDAYNATGFDIDDSKYIKALKRLYESQSEEATRRILSDFFIGSSKVIRIHELGRFNNAEQRDAMRIELRGFRAQEDIHQFLLQISFLKSLMAKAINSSFDSEQLNVPFQSYLNLTPKEILTGLGLNWSTYEQFRPTVYHNILSEIKTTLQDSNGNRKLTVKRIKEKAKRWICEKALIFK